MSETDEALRSAARNVLDAYQWFLDKNDRVALQRYMSVLQEALDVPPEKLPLTGRDWALIRDLAQQILQKGTVGHMATGLRDTAGRRGWVFEVHIRDKARDLTGRIARVQVTLDRVEEQR